MTIAPASAAPDPAAAENAPAAQSTLLALTSLTLIIRVLAMSLLACSFTRAAWRARGDPWDLAFIAGAGAVLAALFWCLQLAERLTPDSPPAERRRLQVGVWSLSTVLSCAFAYRVSLVMPPALVAVVWGVTSLVVLAGFCMLVLGEDQQYRCLEEVHTDDPAGDAKPCDQVRPADELV